MTVRRRGLSASGRVEGAPSRETLRSVRDWVRGGLSRKRYRHTQAVVRRARFLARRNGVDPLKAELAAWLHDAAKERNPGETRHLLRGTPFRLDVWERRIPRLWHPAAGAALAWKVWGIRDREVLDAIRRHAVGGVRMGRMAQVVFAADYLGARGSFRGAVIRRRAVRGLEKAILAKCEGTLAYLTGNGFAIHPGLLETWNSFLSQKRRS